MVSMRRPSSRLSRSWRYEVATCTLTGSWIGLLLRGVSVQALLGTRRRTARSPAQGGTDARQVVPAVPQCVVLNDKLRGNRRAKAQREGSRPVQLLIRERPHRVGRFTAVPAQDCERGSLRYPCLIAS